MDNLDSVSPIDGRYHRVTEPLSKYFSEKALIRYRLKVENEYLIALSEHPGISVRRFSEEEKKMLREVYEEPDARLVKIIETQGTGNIKATNHDVKAVEYYMKHCMKGTSLEDCVEWVHFALTSEDTNNLAYALMLKDSLNEVIKPSMLEVYSAIDSLAVRYKDVPMLARTHGQPASPTTFGKEMKVYAKRLERQFRNLRKAELLVKINGATGNYNAHHLAFPNVDWIAFSESFTERLNSGSGGVVLKANLHTAQIEPHDTYAELFDSIRRFNTVLIDFNQDLWRYISDDWVKQKPVEGEVGSSTMPHKVNPIDFENSEGNLGLADALFEFFSRKLPISRLQRDLSDSTVERNFGTAFAHSLLGYKSALKGLGKVSLNEEKVIEEIERHPEVIAEAYQTILRREGASKPYEALSKLTRGRKVSMDDFREFIDKLDVSDTLKEELRSISPRNYVGLAAVLAMR